MMKMNPTSIIKARLGIQINGPAHAFLTQQCFNHMTKFVPGGTSSHLNQTKDLHVDKIIYQGPDAHYLYTGKLYVDPKYKIGAFPIRGGKISFNPADGMVEGFVSRKGITKIPTSRELNYHKGGGAFWDKTMWTSDGKEIVKKVQAYIDRGCK